MLPPIIFPAAAGSSFSKNLRKIVRSLERSF